MILLSEGSMIGRFVETGSEELLPRVGNGNKDCLQICIRNIRDERKLLKLICYDDCTNL